MIQSLWLDAHLSPALAPWMITTFDISTHALRDLGLRDAEDLEIFEAARTQSAALMTKDRDFVELVERLGPPPPIICLIYSSASSLRSRRFRVVSVTVSVAC